MKAYVNGEKVIIYGFDQEGSCYFIDCYFYKAKYKNEELILKKGDSIFVYTDGVAEATDKDNKLFGTERTLEALNASPDALPKDILKNVRGAVDGFIKDAPQFDDLTMLCLKYNGID